MRKKFLYGISILAAVILLFIVFSDGISIESNINNLRDGIDARIIKPSVFILLWLIRLVAAIPGVTLTILGGLMYSPAEAVVLSLMGLVLSDSLVFLVGRSGLFKSFREKLTKKHGDVMNLVEKYNYKFLALGVLCPVAPTDAICYFSAYLGIGYFKYISTFILSNLPAVFLYSFIGESFQDSIWNTVFIVLTIIASGLMSLKVWNKLKNNTDVEEEYKIS
ncbi:TVP38/TMEM64 family protein [Clostridium culturomicium]|uniref:TVP38/TMEM64 family protein n=1 Tax=Clostridium culturomicium TaxID=1499683 RepID=UPI000694CD65|nr:VTT domain-containing protein [Clostridium culturomicium]